MENQRTSSLAPFRNRTFLGFPKVVNNLLIILVFILMSLPLFTTFNEILTKFAEKTSAYRVLMEYVVPFETRAVAVILAPFGIDAAPTISHLYIRQASGKQTAILFSWNCLGWQSAVLLALTLITGLTGKHPISRKIETLLLGLTGTFLINLVRISVVVLVAYYFGQLTATLVHDYGGTLFTIGWFFFYWWFAYTFILVPGDYRG